MKQGLIIKTKRSIEQNYTLECTGPDTDFKNKASTPLISCQNIVTNTEMFNLELEHRLG